MIKNKNNFGQGMFEVIIAIFVMAMVTIGVVILATNSISNSSFSRNKTLAGKYAQEAIEWLRGQRDEDITTFKTRILSSPYCLDSLAWTNTGSCTSTEVIAGTIFERRVDLSSGLISGKNIIEATVIVSWKDSKGYHEARSVTNFVDIREK